ncbi:MAG TPA: hypothetical protein GXX18_19270 [Bacillales bacterium]|nr:hypothetical protein [Bacillales bacterium]
MRIPKWILFLSNGLLCVAFIYVSISAYNNDARIWWVWMFISILFGYSTTTHFIKAQKESWTSVEIVQDQRTWHIRLISCFIAFTYILLFLIVGIIVFTLGLLSIDFVVYMILAVVTSIGVFAISQIIQLTSR